MRFSNFLEVSCSDWPGQVTAVLFAQGCNMRCPYCANYNTFEMSPHDFGDQEAFNKLRTTGLDHVVLCGGEPTIQQSLPTFCSALKQRGYRIKLDTNGSRPQIIQECLPYLDYIAIDIKTVPEHYRALTGEDLPWAELSHVLNDCDVTVEYRTTLARNPHITPDIIAKLQERLTGKLWTFHREIISDGWAGNQSPWTEEEWTRLMRLLKRKR